MASYSPVGFIPHMRDHRLEKLVERLWFYRNLDTYQIAQEVNAAFFTVISEARIANVLARVRDRQHSETVEGTRHVG